MASVEKTVDEIKQLEDIDKKVRAIHDKYSGVKSRDKRRNKWMYGGLALFYLALIVFAVIVQAWSAALSTLGLALWLGLVWYQANLIIEYRFLTAVQRDLHSLEREEMERVVFEQLEKMPTLKRTKAAKATA